MSVTLSNPKFSFVTLSPGADAECNLGANVPLPMREGNSLAFQFQMKCTGAGEVTSILAAPDNGIALAIYKTDGTFLYDYTATGGLYFKKYQTGPLEVTVVWDNPLTINTISTMLKCGECFLFKVIIAIATATVDLSAFTNPFYRACDDCYISILSYRSEEDSVDFRYCSTLGFTNKIPLPLYLGNPQFKDEEKVYPYGNGGIKVVSSVTRKEYAATVGIFHENTHEKIKIALSSDFVSIEASRYTGQIRKNGDYSIGWEYENQTVAPATVKVNTIPYNVKNSNCANCSEDSLCATLTDITTATDYEVGEAFWSVEISGCTFTAPPAVSEAYQVYVKQAVFGSYAFVGTVVFDVTGAVISTPNPFVIGGIAGGWDAVDIKLVNLCGAELIRTVFNPCDELVGLGGTAFDNDINWGVNITSLVYSNWPPVGSTRTISIYRREEGSGGAFTYVGDITVGMPAPVSPTLTPNPFVVGVLPLAWDKVEIKAEYTCGKVLLQNFSNPTVDCVSVTSVSISDITNMSAIANYPRGVPTPAGFYDWELWDITMTTLIDSATGFIMPGGTQLVGLSGLLPATDYVFRVRANCTGGSYSAWTSADFVTLP